MQWEAAAAIAALIVAIGSAFFTAGVTMQQQKDLKDRQEKLEDRVGVIEKDIGEAAVSRARLETKVDGVSGQLDRVLNHLTGRTGKDD